MTIETTKGGTAFTGEHVNVYAMTVIAKALRLYADTGMKVNRAYTPKNMLAAASRYTGQTFKSRDYIGAATALETAARQLAARE